MEMAVHKTREITILNKRSAIPRYNEIRDILAIKICKGLGVPRIK